MGMTMAAEPAQALSFNFNYESSVTQTVRDAMGRAGAIWSSYLQDDVVLNIDVGFGGLSYPYLGGARPEMVRVSYEDVIQQMGLDRVSSDDKLAFSNLPTHTENGTTSVRRFINRTRENFGLGYVDTSVDSLWMTRANAKALGIIASTPNDTTVDASIRLSSLAKWDFDHRNGVKSRQYDFMGTALHELGHALGFLSGVDVLDYYVGQGIFNAAHDYDYITPLDLFRSSAWLKGQKIIDWTVDDLEEYFSVDGGITKIAKFADGSNLFFGNDFQISHWDAQENGVMRPALATGQTNAVTTIDLRLLDAIGWDLAPQSQAARTSMTSQSQVDYKTSTIAYTVGEGSFDSALGWGSASSASTDWSFWQEGTFLASTAEPAQSTPEGSSVLGAIALGVIGWLSYGRRGRTSSQAIAPTNPL